MRLQHCVICGTAPAEPLLSVARVPIHPFCPPAALGLTPGFGALHIVDCVACGHRYNAAFERDRVDALYAAAVLTNTPVSDSMMANLEQLTAYILTHAPGRPVIADVGGGTGVLARTLARRGGEVHLVEPSKALRPEDFAGSGVTLHQSTFPAPTLGDRIFDVIVVRQVVEHVPEPLPFLELLRSRLNPRGVAYIEVPSGEYIDRTGSVIDFHYPHVHYYRVDELEALLARAGFDVAETIDIKDGHDRGFLLRAGQPRPVPAPPRPATRTTAADLAARATAGRERLRAIKGSVALYGATAYSQALFGLYPIDAAYAVVVDDTPMYDGQLAYGPGVEVPIRRPSPEVFNGIDAVIITAYLHDAGIYSRIRQLGFDGRVYTVRADHLAGRSGRPPGLFDAGLG